MNAPELHQATALKRDCDAVLIPHGTPILIAAGTEVVVTQALGGSVTVNVHGNLARIAGRDLDALGMEPQAAAPQARDQARQGGGVNEGLLWEQLRTCYDPEIPINIVVLGLVYNCEVTPLPGAGLRHGAVPGRGRARQAGAGAERHRGQRRAGLRSALASGHVVRGGAPANRNVLMATWFDIAAAADLPPGRRVQRDVAGVAIIAVEIDGELL